MVKLELLSGPDMGSLKSQNQVVIFPKELSVKITVGLDNVVGFGEAVHYHNVQD